MSDNYSAKHEKDLVCFLNLLHIIYISTYDWTITWFPQYSPVSSLHSLVDTYIQSVKRARIYNLERENG